MSKSSISASAHATLASSLPAETLEAPPGGPILSPSLRYSLLDPPSTSEKTAHAQELLSKVARNLASPSQQSGTTEHSDVFLRATSRAANPTGSPMDMHMFEGSTPSSGDGDDGDAGADLPPAPPPATETKLQSNGSFPDVLALLMHGRDSAAECGSRTSRDAAEGPVSPSRPSRDAPSLDAGHAKGSSAPLSVLKEDDAAETSGSNACAASAVAESEHHKLPSALLEECALVLGYCCRHRLSFLQQLPCSTAGC